MPRLTPRFSTSAAAERISASAQRSTRRRRAEGMSAMAKVKSALPKAGLDRRQALLGMGVSASALAFSFTLPLTSSPATAGVLQPVTAWIAIDTGGIVVIQVGSQDMGQGILSGLAQVAASELM